MGDPLEDKVKLYGIAAGTGEKVLVATFDRPKEAKLYVCASMEPTAAQKEWARRGPELEEVPASWPVQFYTWSVLYGFNDYQIMDCPPGIPHNPQICRGG